MNDNRYMFAIAQAVGDIQMQNDDDYPDVIDAWAVKIAEIYDREPDEVEQDIRTALDEWV